MTYPSQPGQPDNWPDPSWPSAQGPGYPDPGMPGSPVAYGPQSVPPGYGIPPGYAQPYPYPTTRPTNGLMSAETKKPNENAPAARPRSQPNSSSSGGRSRENAVRDVTLTAMVTNATAMITQP